MMVNKYKDEIEAIVNYEDHFIALPEYEPVKLF
jgi:hypothetical protein